jgi:hypothetical protein
MAGRERDRYDSPRERHKPSKQELFYRVSELAVMPPISFRMAVKQCHTAGTLAAQESR